MEGRVSVAVQTVHCVRDDYSAGCHHLSELLSNQKRLPLAEVAGYAERS